MEYILLKSKDDYSYEHYKTSPLSKLTGFVGTAGDGILSENKRITLFVDPRYHIQAENQTKGKGVDVVKMSGQYGFIEYLKDFLLEGSILKVPDKSTSYGMYKKMCNLMPNVKIEPYYTEEDNSSIDNIDSPIFEVPIEITGKSIKDKIQKLKYENFLITNLEEIAYLLNLRSYKTKNSSTFRCKLFVKSANKIVLFTDYSLPKLPDFIEIKKMDNYEDYIKNEKSVTTDLNSISLHDYNLIKNCIPIEKNPIAKMASIKNKCEINHYIDCFKRLDMALFEFRDSIKEGLSEFELNKIFEKALIKNGAKTTSFKTILSIDSNSSIIHYTDNSKEKIVKNGSTILLDCGGYYEGGYATDITRVFSFGKIREDVKEIYTAVLKAQMNVYYSKLLMTDELDNVAKKILKKYEKKGFYFPHGLGHGIGIPVHQAPPTLSNSFRIKLKNGNVFTIEPGLYKEKAFGIRLENTVYLKELKKITLSKFPYEDNLINYDMLNKKEQKWLSCWQEFYKGN